MFAVLFCLLCCAGITRLAAETSAEGVAVAAARQSAAAQEAFLPASVNSSTAICALCAGTRERFMPARLPFTELGAVLAGKKELPFPQGADRVSAVAKGNGQAPAPGAILAAKAPAPELGSATGSENALDFRGTRFPDPRNRRIWIPPLKMIKAKRLPYAVTGESRSNRIGERRPQWANREVRAQRLLASDDKANAQLEGNAARSAAAEEKARIHKEVNSERHEATEEKARIKRKNNAERKEAAAENKISTYREREAQGEKTSREDE